MIRLYFGQPGDEQPTKEEVEAFITDEKGLTRGDGDELRWWEGLGELIDLGMAAYADRPVAVNSGDRELLHEFQRSTPLPDHQGAKQVQ